MIETRVQELLSSFPIVAIVGARQVGKTTCSHLISKGYPREVIHLDLEKDSDLAKLAEPQLYLQRHSDKLIVLDEIQRKPELFPLLRAIADETGRPGQFLILGSSSPELLQQSSETLAGRIYFVELSGFALNEIESPMEWEKLWLRGGYPRSYLAESDSQSVDWREGLLQAVLRRDIPSAGFRSNTQSLKRFLMMVAHCHGQLWNASKIGASLGIGYKTIQHYLDVFESIFLLRRLESYQRNLKKRLVKTPKIYVRDSGLLHHLLKIQGMEDLFSHSGLGASWEGWCIEQLCTQLPQTCDVTHYRASGGAEIDLIIQGSSSQPLVAVEFKWSMECRPQRGFYSALEDIQPASGFVVYPGKEHFPIAENIEAVPVTELGRIIDRFTS